MKKILLIAVVMMAYTQASAQLLSFGLKGGISSSQIKIDKPSTYDEIDRESEFGFHAGLFGRVQAPVIGLYVQPEVLFSSTGGTIRLTDDVGTDVVNYNFNRIDIPVMLGWKFGAFRINAGPTFNFLTKAEEKINQDDFEDVKDQFKNSTVGYQAGVGFDLGKLLLDFKYEGNLSKFGESVDLGIAEFETDARNTQLILSLGFRF